MKQPGCVLSHAGVLASDCSCGSCLDLMPPLTAAWLHITVKYMNSGNMANIGEGGILLDEEENNQSLIIVEILS